MSDTPRVINKKVANISTKFMCETCKVKKPTENELRTHIQMIHKREKRTLAEMKDGPIRRVASVTLSPPNKIKKTGMNTDIDTRDKRISDLEVKNIVLVDTVEKKQDQLTKQANIIGDMREKVHGLDLKVEVVENENERLNNVNNDMVDTLVSKNYDITNLEHRLPKSQETDSKNEMKYAINELREALEEEKSKRDEAEERIKATNMKCFNLENQNESMRNGNINSKCKV